MVERTGTSRRGIKVLAFLAIALVGSAGAVLGVISFRTPQSPGVTDQDRLIRAKDAVSEQSWARALDLLESITRNGKGDLETRLLLGQVLLELGRLTRARDLYNALHKESPQDFRVILGLGQVHERSGELDLAVTAYKRATEMKKDDARSFRLLGLAQVKRGDSMAALFSIRQSLKLLPGQEDLSRLLNEIGVSRQAKLSAPDRFRNPRGADPFEEMNIHPGSGRESLLPDIPDPLRGMPRPDGRVR
jgi:cytochrome c-type biogenesis protein CcmH/NrfG